MDRLILFVVACIAQVGCQAPVGGLFPFANSSATRVPPPPTGVIGRPGYYPEPPSSLPPFGAGTSTFPPVEYTSPGGNWQPTSGPDDNRRRVDAAFAANSAVPTPDHTPVKKSDALTWLDPDTKGIPGPLPHYDQSSSVVAYPSPRHNFENRPPARYQPRLLPRTGPVESLPPGSVAAAPPVRAAPRIRGFVNSGVQPLRVPAELAKFRNPDVLQASADQEWNSRDRY